MNKEDVIYRLKKITRQIDMMSETQFRASVRDGGLIFSNCHWGEPLKTVITIKTLELQSPQEGNEMDSHKESRDH